MDFFDIHHYLQPEYPEQANEGLRGAVALGQGTPSYKAVNPRNPKAGIHLLPMTCFNVSALHTAVYIKNQFKDDCQEATGVKVCLKIIISPRNDVNGYEGFKSPYALAIELPKQALGKAYAVLTGRECQFEFLVEKPGQISKFLSFEYLKSQNGVVVTVQEGRHRLEARCDAWSCLEVATQIIAIVKIHYPWMSDTTIIDLLLAGHINNTSEESSPHSSKTISVRPIESNQKKALYAIWNKHFKDQFTREEIERMQETLNYEQADEFVKLVNERRIDEALALGEKLLRGVVNG